MVLIAPQIGSKAHPHEQDRVGACQVVKADGWHSMFYIGGEDRIVASKLNNSKRHWSVSGAASKNSFDSFGSKKFLLRIYQRFNSMMFRRNR